MEGNHVYSQHELGYLNWLRPGYTHLLSAAAPPKYVTWIYGQIAEQIAGVFKLYTIIIHHLLEGMSMIVTPEFVCWNRWIEAADFPTTLRLTDLIGN